MLKNQILKEKFYQSDTVTVAKELLGKKLTHIFKGQVISVVPAQIITNPRVGIEYAEESKDWPLRFYVKDSKFISKK